MASNESREGQRIARLFRQSRGLQDVRACDLVEILADRSLDVAESEHLEPGFAAYLIRAGEGGGIMLSGGQTKGRRRFSIAHELGHFLIPKHANEGISGYCLDADMRVRSTDAQRIEWEANDFAAELLMPQHLFRRDVAQFDPSIASIEKLAGDAFYNVSLLAAGWRFVQLTAQAVALVVATDGRVTWVARSRAFDLPLTERQQPVHPDTVAASVFRGEGACVSPVAVRSGVWLDRGVHVESELFESAYEIPSLRQVVSLIWRQESVDSDDW
jgi:hypothetical protein